MPSSHPDDHGSRIRRLFDEVADLPPEARAAHLDLACREDPDLRSQVEALLEAHAQAADILEPFVRPLQGFRLIDEDGQPVSAADPLRLLGARVGPYRLTGFLGGGGMGVVYEAQDTRLKRDVALKFLPPELTRDPDARERFVQEAQAASALDHPNICTVYDIGETADGRTFIAMACYRGQTLKQRIARGPLPVDETLDIALQMAEGLGRAHEAGIVHRDVKPANVMLTERGRVKLLDFGLAKVADVSLTQTGTTMGTVAYMSPEQARGDAVDARTDVWSLGVVLYEMLTGERPFRGGYEHAVLYAILHLSPVPLKEKLPGISAALASVVDRALTKDPAERYGHAGDFGAGLRAVRDEDAPSAAGRPANRPPSLFSRHRRGLLVGGVAAFGIALATLVYGPDRFYGPDRSVSTLTASPDRHPRIAVLPLEERSNGDMGFAAGMTDELVVTLTRVEGLRVVPRETLAEFTEPGRSLSELADLVRADYFVGGSVRWAGARLRISVNLIDPTTETTLWGKSFPGDQEDVFRVQQQVAREIVQELEVQLTPEEAARLKQARQVDPRAYRSYSWGRTIRHQSPANVLIRIQRAIPHYERAIEIDSTFAEGYLALAGSYAYLSMYRVLPREKADSLAERYLERALALDPEVPGAHSLKSTLRLLAGDLPEAERELRKAVELYPGNPNSYCDLALSRFRTGHVKEAFDLAGEALTRDPVSAYGHQVYVQALIYDHQYEAALVASREARQFYPEGWTGYWGLGHAYLGLRRFPEAVEVFEEMAAYDSSWVGNLGYAYAVMGRREDAIRIVDDLKRRNPDSRGQLDHISRIYAALGEIDAALDWLEEHHLLLDFFKGDPAFDPLRSEPRFQALLEEMGLES